ncbi:hypothetical protein CBER1_07418 [Cercospora berteroae]|uniref:Uncharacterized protein n=1 Tax=Cercospora berteroae TaxID=357750 RepID=A0A2S6CMV0_9PEZI|nr:hypothetical protein CBER1_07418 [Cercospora berteroae]
MNGYDAAQYAFYTVFLTLHAVCYGCEIVTRTPWIKLSQRSRDFQGKLGKSLTSESDSSLDRIAATSPAKEAPVDQTSGARDTTAEATTKQGQLVHVESAQEEQVRSQIVGASKLPLPAWLICLPGWLWAASIIPAWLQLFANAAPGHAIPLTTLVSEWNVNRTIGADIRLLTDVNPDIAGLFHKEDSAAKEIGSASLLTLFYINFNSVKAATPGYKQLTFPEVVLVCISLDLAAATLHMTTSAKDTLAARKFIFASTLNQLVAYGNIIAMLARIRHNYKGLDCTYLVWWSRIDSCTGPSGPVWMYIAIRGLILLHGIWLDWCHTFSFDSIEEDWSEPAPADQDTDDDKDEISKYPYASLPGTVFSKWVDWLPSTIVAISRLEVIVARLPPDASITDWGQSAALVLAIAGAIHWFYVLTWQVGRKLWKGRETRALNFPRYHKDWNPSITGTGDDLIRPSKAGDLKKIRRALKHDAKIDYVDPNGRMTALLYAVQRDHVDLVRELMSANYKASPSVPQTRPALLFAVESGSKKTLRFFTDTKNLSLSELDNDRDAIWFAARYGRLQTIELLIEAWKKKSPTDGIRTALKLADERREPALAVAVEAQHEEVVKYLVKQLRDANLTTSYAKALAKATQLRDETALNALLTFNPNPETIRTPLCQWPLLHDAIATRKADNIIEFLAKSYRTILNTVDVFDAVGRTPLGLAAIHNDEDTASLLWDLAPIHSRRDRTTPTMGIHRSYWHIKKPEAVRLISYGLRTRTI